MAENSDVKDLVKRYDNAYSDDANWRVTYQDLADYILPRKSDIITSKTPGSKKTQKLFDSTAPHANEQLSASISSSITPKSTQWFWIKTRDSGLNKITTVELHWILLYLFIIQINIFIYKYTKLMSFY